MGTAVREPQAAPAILGQGQHALGAEGTSQLDLMELETVEIVQTPAVRQKKQVIAGTMQGIDESVGQTIFQTDLLMNDPDGLLTPHPYGYHAPQRTASQDNGQEVLLEMRHMRSANKK